MMIFLTILKIIGIVLCVILGIIVVILFVPICYELDADIDQKEFKARIHWLGRLARFEFQWKEKAHAVLKILWFVIDFTDPEAVAARKAKKEEKARKKLQKQQKKEAKEREKEQRQSQKEKQKEAADREERAQQREEFRRQQGETVESKNRADSPEKIEENTDDTTENISEDTSVIKEVSISNKVDNLEEQTAQQTEQQTNQMQNHTIASDQQKVQQKNNCSEDVNKEAKQSVLDKLKAAHAKVGSIKEKVKSGISVIQFLREQELIPAVWVKLKVFLLHIRPRVLRGHLKFGLSNPADTGQVLGGIAMIPFLYQTELQIEPDFEAEDNYIQGQVYSRGHMCCIHLVILIIRLLMDKKIRSVIHAIRENK